MMEREEGYWMPARTETKENNLPLVDCHVLTLLVLQRGAAKRLELTQVVVPTTYQLIEKDSFLHHHPMPSTGIMLCIMD